MANQGNIREKTEVIVVMVPLPTQGHLNQLLHLSRIISAYNIPVHYTGAATHNRQAKLRVRGWDPLAISNIHFHELSVPTFEAPPPNPNALTKYPAQLLPSFNATVHLREPFCALLHELSSSARRVIVIHDSLMFWVVQDVPSVPNAESYSFHSISAFAMLGAVGKPVMVDGEPVKDLPLGESLVPPEVFEFIKLQNDVRKCNSGNLYNSCRAIEGLYLDILAEAKLNETDKHFVVGPFNPVVITEKNTSTRHQKCLEWLDKKPPKSVIFVSFGTTTSLSNEEVKEIANGLERSGQNFIWVLREADRGDIFVGDDRGAQLPEGYEEKVKERGLIVRDWAPQLEILAHPSTGGFMSHCGWNSCIESISMGVPIAAWPMHSDQPMHAILLARVLKIGIVVRDWAHRDEIVKSETVENAVKRLMVSAEGDEIRQRAAELSKAVKKSVMDGGDSRSDMDNFIAQITR